MPDCDYCGASFDDEEAYLSHLGTEHADELGRIDRRRVAAHGELETESGGNPIIVYGLTLSVVLLVIGALGYVVTVGMTDDAVHDHGQITVTVDGEEIEFDQSQYYQEELGGTFHFHPGDGNTWHMHPDRVTFEDAMADIEMPVTDSSITVHDETFDDEDPDASVEMTIDDRPAALEDELSDGDHIRITVETDDGDGVPDTDPDTESDV